MPKVLDQQVLCQLFRCDRCGQTLMGDRRAVVLLQAQAIRLYHGRCQRADATPGRTMALADFLTHLLLDVGASAWAAHQARWN